MMYLLSPIEKISIRTRAFFITLVVAMLTGWGTLGLLLFYLLFVYAREKAYRFTGI